MRTKKLKVHFIGIGGIGVSALAQYYLSQGHQVSGSDLASSEITEALKKKGVKLTGTFPVNCDLVIYSPAVPESNPELIKARKLGIKCQGYPEALGELTKKYFTIAVSGTHGKSTTCAMIGLLLVKAGFDPTVIIGTKVKEFGNTNYRMGNSKYLVIEADEHFGSFLNYWPKIIVLTNLEKDHLDYYKNLKNIKKAFNEFVSHLPKDGVLFDLRNQTDLFGFVNQTDRKKLRKILKVPGEHNVSNALAALAVARTLRIPDKISFKSLSEFRGTWRRFEEKDLKIGNCKLKIISDYAHHPTEVEATLRAVREKWPKREIWCIFQPHQYQRTFYLFNEFVEVFKKSLIDKVMLTDIYDVAGREERSIKNRVSSKELVKAVNNPKVTYLAKKQITNYIKSNLQGNEIIIIMGAGDIYKLVNIFC